MSVQARILGQSRRQGQFCPVTFDIEVCTPGAKCEKHIVQRRYASFLALEAALGPRFETLPPLPPKSTFRKRLWSASFMADRERRLGEFLAALLARDPAAGEDILRRFLAVGTLEHEQSRHESRPSARKGGLDRGCSSSTASTSSSHSYSTSLGSTILGMISESEEEDESGFDAQDAQSS